MTMVFISNHIKPSLLIVAHRHHPRESQQSSGRLRKPHTQKTGWSYSCASKSVSVSARGGGLQWS